MENKLSNSTNIVGSNKKIRNGALFSYLTILFEIVVNFFVIRTLTKQLGDDYGIYTLALNVISIFLVDFGLSQAVTKFVAKFRVEGDKEKESAFLGVVLKTYFTLDIIIALACVVLFFFLGNIYQGLSYEQLGKFKIVYIIVAIYSCVTFPMMPLNGILSAYEEFSAIKIMTAIQKLLSALLMLAVILTGSNLFFAVLANVSSALIVAAAKLIYSSKKCVLRPTFKNKYKGMLKSILAFTVWIAVSSLATRLSISLMSSVLASVRDAASVAIFGIAVTIETYAYTFSNVLSGLFLPKITKLDSDDSYDLIDKNSFKVGKIQICISGLILSGFIVFGRQFLNLYLEPMYSGSYWPTILLLATIFVQSPLVIQETVCIANGSLKQSAILELVICAIRLGLCYLFAKLFGVIGLALTYSLVGILMYILKMVFVYRKHNKLNVKHVVFGIYLKSILPIVISILVGLLITKIIAADSWIKLIALIVVYCISYVVSFSLLFFNKAERDAIYKKTISRSATATRIVSQLKMRGKYGVPVLFAIIPSIFSLLCSNYPIDKISFLFATIVSIVALFTYIYYIFPFMAAKTNKSTFLRSITCSGFLVVAFFSIAVFLNMMITKSYGNVFGYFRILMYIMSGFFISQTFTFEEFFKFFKRVFSIICLISLFFYAIINLFGFNFSIQMYNGQYYNYFYIFYAIASPSYLTKNCSVFWEPGIFASIASFMIIIECLFVKKPFKRKIPYLLLYTASVFSSGSLAGLLLVALMVPIFVSSLNFKKSKSYQTLASIFALLFATAFVLFFAFPDLIIKMFPFIESKGVSFYTRILSFRIDLQIFLKNPIIGCGGRNYEAMFSDIVSSNYAGIVDSSISTTGYFAAVFGIPGLMITLVLICGIFFIDNKKVGIRQKIYLIIIVLLIINKEPHSLSLISWILFFYIIKNIKPMSNWEYETEYNEYSIDRRLKRK